jgi:hypothetical protein
MADKTHPRMRPRQKKAIELFKEQVLKGDFKSIEDTLLAAGYAPNSAKQVSNVMEGIRPHVEDTIKWMEDHRLKVQEHMAGKVDSASYAELTRSLDVLTHNLQLLGGKPTANLQLSTEDRARLDNLIED